MFQRETTTATDRLISSCNFLLNREIRAYSPLHCAPRRERGPARRAHEITFLQVDGGFAFVLLFLSLGPLIRLNARRKTDDWLITNEQIPREIRRADFHLAASQL